MMIQLIVTGNLEKESLGDSLSRIFQNVSFSTIRADGFTSETVPQNLPIHGQAKPSVVKLAERMVAEVDPGRQGTPADLVILVEDIELKNTHNVEAIIKLYLLAIERAIIAHRPNQSSQAACRRLIQERCSFHLLSPMIESYFFSDVYALQEHIKTARPSMICPTNLEDFNAFSDLTFAKRTFADPVLLSSQPHPHDPTPCYHHPKEYIEYLCTPHDQEYAPKNRRKKNIYKETKQGKDALLNLNWDRVFLENTRVPFLRSLIEDISNFLGMENPYPGETSPLTSIFPANKRRILRNI